MVRTEVTKFISGIDDIDIVRYVKYLDSIKPDSDLEFFRRFVFAYCSIQTAWEKNVELYNLLKHKTWIEDKDKLYNIILNTRAGFQNMRTRYLFDFAQKFWEDPQSFLRQENEDWDVYRDRVVKNMLGMGMAKVSFTLEMIYAAESEVICLDRHLLRFYKHKGGKNSGCTKTQYMAYEKHWRTSCKARNVSPTIARWIYWDKLQKQPDSRYWAYVLEAPPLLAVSS